MHNGASMHRTLLYLHSCTAILALSLLSGAWVPDNGGAVAVLGLMSVYVSSTECLTLVRNSRVQQAVGTGVLAAV